MRTLVPTAAFLALLLLLPDPVRGCSCGALPQTPAERRLQFPAVFHGKVTASEDDTAFTRRIRFAVIKDYSVDGSMVGDTATIWTYSQSSACGIGFPVGEEVLIFADTSRYPPLKPKGGLSSGLCHHNAWGAGLQEALRGMDEAVSVRAAGPRPAARGHRAAVACGQVLFEGGAQANGAIRGGTRSR